MPVFPASITTFQGACQEVADAAGASADNEMTTRAGRSVMAALKHWNNRAKWSWLRTVANPVMVVAPFQASIGVSAGQASATGTGFVFVVDDAIVGSGFVAGTRVSALGGTSAIGFNTSATGLGAGVNAVTVTATRDLYDLPSDFKALYTGKTLQFPRTLRHVTRRMVDRGGGIQSAGTPLWYDTFQVGEKNKLKLVDPPNQADVLLYAYHRRITVPSATAVTSVLDVPQDYDAYLIAWAKWHFLTDKGQPERAGVWLSLANEGLTAMLRDQMDQPDEDIVFTPGHTSFWYGPNDVRPYLYDAP